MVRHDVPRGTAGGRVDPDDRPVIVDGRVVRYREYRFGAGRD
jgi:hypothetical protein